MHNYASQALFLGNLSDAVARQLDSNTPLPASMAIDRPKAADKRCDQISKGRNYIDYHFKEPSLPSLSQLTLNQKIALQSNDIDYRNMQLLLRDMRNRERDIESIGKAINRKLDGQNDTKKSQTWSKSSQTVTGKIKTKI